LQLLLSWQWQQNLEQIFKIIIINGDYVYEYKIILFSSKQSLILLLLLLSLLLLLPLLVPAVVVALASAAVRLNFQYYNSNEGEWL
jgi:hypothetical protein